MTAYFPSSVATSLQLLTAVNNKRFTLSDDVADDALEIEVTSTSGAPDEGVIGIGTELIRYTSKTSLKFICDNIDKRGYDGTTPVIHSMTADGGEVFMGPAACYHNILATEIVSIETELGINLTNIIKKSLVTTKGDLIVASGSSTPIRLGVGTNDYVLTAASGETSGIKWSAVPSMGDKTRVLFLTPGGSIIPATGGCGQSQTDGTYKSYLTNDFDKDSDEVCFWHFPVLPDYDGGNVIFNVICLTTVTTGNVKFVIYTGDVADGATFDAALGTTITFDAKTVDGTAGDEFIASKTADPGWTAGNFGTIKIMRDVSEDSAAADVKVIGVEILMEVT